MLQWCCCWFHHTRKKVGRMIEIRRAAHWLNKYVTAQCEQNRFFYSFSVWNWFPQINKTNSCGGCEALLLYLLVLLYPRIGAYIVYTSKLHTIHSLWTNTIAGVELPYTHMFVLYTYIEIYMLVYWLNNANCALVFVVFAFLGMAIIRTFLINITRHNKFWTFFF